MLVQRITTSGGIDDIKLIAENDSDVLLIKQLGAAGTLINRSSLVGSTIVFRPISSNSIVSPAVPLISSGKIGKLDFTLRQNQNFTVDLKFKDGAGAPIDLTAYTAIKLQIKAKKSGAAIVSLALATGLTISGDDDNILRVALSKANTLLLCDEQYYHDLLMENGASNNYYVEGIINVDRTGTR